MENFNTIGYLLSWMAIYLRNQGTWWVTDGLRWINPLISCLGEGTIQMPYHPLEFCSAKRQIVEPMEDRLPMAVSGGTTSLAWLEEEVAVWGWWVKFADSSKYLSDLAVSNSAKSDDYHEFLVVHWYFQQFSLWLLPPATWEHAGTNRGTTSLEPCQPHVTQGGMASVADGILESEGKKQGHWKK